MGWYKTVNTYTITTHTRNVFHTQQNFVNITDKNKCLANL